MSADFHIKFDGVEGEATHKDHKGEIQVLSWSWDVSNSSGAAAGGGSGRGKAEPGSFNFMHLYDKASPNLAKKCAQGVHFKEVKMTARKSGETQVDFLVITMKEVFITHVAPSGSSGGDVNEAVAMSYKEIGFDYKPQDETGKMVGVVKFGWNVATTAIT
jgi:type VI secretion system secreted protein Hcp